MTGSIAPPIPAANAGAGASRAAVSPTNLRIVPCRERSARLLISRFLRLQVGVDDLPVLGDKRAFDDLVVPVDLQGLVLLVDHGLEEGVEVLGVEARGIDRNLACEIERGKDAHAVWRGGGLAW